MLPHTEQSSNHNHLEQQSAFDLLMGINEEDRTVPDAVAKVIPKLTALVEVIAKKMKNGGRLFYIGAGTSGRLGILDASECPPTFGVSHDLVIGLIAGGDSAIRKAVEHAEDDTKQGWKDLLEYKIDAHDVLIGIAASGSTPYVIGALQEAQKHGIITGCITCNQQTAIAEYSDHPIEVIVGPEFVTGSTRMKSGTAQKLVLNMISTSVMILLGRVKGNRMVDMQLSNNKLIERGTRMIADTCGISHEKAKEVLLEQGSVRAAIDHVNNS